jgi:hypothetical protein
MMPCSQNLTSDPCDDARDVRCVRLMTSVWAGSRVSVWLSYDVITEDSPRDCAADWGSHTRGFPTQSLPRARTPVGLHVKSPSFSFDFNPNCNVSRNFCVTPNTKFHENPFSDSRRPDRQTWRRWHAHFLRPQVPNATKDAMTLSFRIISNSLFIIILSLHSIAIKLTHLN